MKKRVLVAEDNNDMRRLMELTFRGDDRYDLYLAEDGDRALEIAQAVKPDIAFLDVMMPGTGGLEVCRRLKQNAETSNIRIVVVTALSQEMDRKRAKDAGADKYLVKPFSPTDLLDELENLLAICVSSQ